MILKGAVGAGAIQMISILSICCNPSSEGRVEMRFTIGQDSCTGREGGASANSRAGGG